MGPDQSVYVSDWGNNRIQRFSSEGTFIETIGGPEAENGSLHSPSKPAVDSDGYVYVSDWGNESVKIFAPDTTFIQKLRGEATLSKWAQDFFGCKPGRKHRKH